MIAVAHVYDLGEVTPSADAAAQQFPQPPPRAPKAKAPTRVIPECLRAFRFKGGSQLLGFDIGPLEALAPTFFTSVGDLSIEPISAAAHHNLLAKTYVDTIVAALPRLPRPEPAVVTDPELHRRLTEEGHARVLAMRAWTIANDVRDPEQLEMLASAIGRQLTQALLLGSRAAVEIEERAWSSPRLDTTMRFGGGVKRVDAHPFLPPLGALLGSFDTPDEWLMAPTVSDAFAATLTAERNAVAREGTRKAKARHVDRERTTPFAANLIAARTPIGREASATMMQTYEARCSVLEAIRDQQNAARAKRGEAPLSAFEPPPPPTLHNGYLYALGTRAAWPVDIPVLSVVVESSDAVNAGRNQLWELLPDSAEIFLTAAEKEGGVGSAPGHILSALIKAQHATVTTRTATSPVDARHKEFKKRVRLLRDYLVRARPALEGDGGTITVGPGTFRGETPPARRQISTGPTSPGQSFARQVCLQYAVARLSLRAECVARELHDFLGDACWLDMPQMITTCARLSAAPAEWIFDPIDGGKP